jgi:hypothetical protein
MRLLSSSCRLWKGLLFLSATMMSSSVHAAQQQQQQLTKYQEKVTHAWNSLVSDFDTFKAIFAEDAKIKMCLKGMPFCTEGTFHEMLEGFRVAFTSFQVKHKFLTGQSHHDTFLVEWVNSVETKEGCKAMWWGYSTYEFNQEGKIKRFVGLSEESEDVLHCVSKVSGINAEL